VNYGQPNENHTQGISSIVQVHLPGHRTCPKKSQFFFIALWQCCVNVLFAMETFYGGPDNLSYSLANIPPENLEITTILSLAYLEFGTNFQRKFWKVLHKRNYPYSLSIPFVNKINKEKNPRPNWGSCPIQSVHCLGGLTQSASSLGIMV